MAEIGPWSQLQVRIVKSQLFFSFSKTFLSQSLNPDKEQAEKDTDDKTEERAIVEEKQGEETAKKGNLKYIVDVTVAYPEGKI